MLLTVQRTARALIVISSVFMTQQSLAISHHLQEVIQIYHYQSSTNQSTIKTTTTSYDNTNTLLASARIKQITLDNTTGNRLTQQTPNGDSIKETYDALARMTKIIYHSSAYPDHDQIQQTLYSPKAIITIAPDNYQRKVELDALGRPLQTTDNVINDNQLSSVPTHILNTTQYNDLGEVSQKTDIKNNVTIYHYDAQGRKRTSRQALADGSQLMSHADYNDVTNIDSQYQQNGEQRSAIAISQQNNVAKPIADSIESHGQMSSPITQASYDNLAQKITGKQRLNRLGQSVTLHYHYNALTQLGQVAMYSGDDAMQIKMTHDLNGKLISKIFNPNSQADKRYQLTYDGNGQLLSQQLDKGNGESTTETFTYDVQGNKVSKTNWAGQQLVYHYQSILGKARLTSLEVEPNLPGHLIHHYTYDLTTGLLKQMYDTTADSPNNKQKEIDFTYTVDHLLAKKTYRTNAGLPSVSIENHYDAKTRQLQQRIDTAKQATNYYYDNTGNLRQVTTPSATVYFDYDAFNRVIERRRGQKKTGVEYQVDTTRYHYDDQNHITKVTQQLANDNALVSDERDYRYRPDGNIASMSVHYDNADGTSLANYSEQYTYSYQNRLLKVIHKDKQANLVTHQKITTYAYNDRGDRLNQLITEKNLKMASQKTRQAIYYTHNAYDQVIAKQTADGINSFSYDANGNLSQDSTGKQYDYNAEAQLTRYQDGKNHAQFEYYPDGERASVSDGKTIIHYYTINGLVINKVDGEGNSASYLLVGKQRLARNLQRLSAPQQVRFYGADLHGNIVNTFERGRTWQHRNYDSDGNLLTTAGNTSLSIDYDEFQYSGECSDPPSVGGMQYLHSRMYAPTLASFIQRDSYILSNDYGYGEGNPLRYTDPSGHSVKDIWDKINYTMGQWGQSPIFWGGVSVAVIASICGGAVGRYIWCCELSEYKSGEGVMKTVEQKLYDNRLAGLTDELKRTANLGQGFPDPLVAEHITSHQFTMALRGFEQSEMVQKGMQTIRNCFQYEARINLDQEGIVISRESIEKQIGGLAGEGGGEVIQKHVAVLRNYLQTMGFNAQDGARLEILRNKVELLCAETPVAEGLTHSELINLNGFLMHLKRIFSVETKVSWYTKIFS